MDKKYRWLHNLLRIHGIELQPEMIICSQCRNAFYKENKHRRSSNVGPVFDDDGLKENPEEENEKLQRIISFDNLLVLEAIYGNDDDYIYCVFCMKSDVEMTPLSLSEHMTLLCDHKLYIHLLMLVAVLIPAMIRLENVHKNELRYQLNKLLS